MSEAVQQKAAQAETLVKEVTAIELPEPVAEVQPLEQADAPTSEAIRVRMDQLDMPAV